MQSIKLKALKSLPIFYLLYTLYLSYIISQHGPGNSAYVLDSMFYYISPIAVVLIPTLGLPKLAIHFIPYSWAMNFTAFAKDHFLIAFFTMHIIVFVSLYALSVIYTILFQKLKNYIKRV